MRETSVVAVPRERDRGRPTTDLRDRIGGHRTRRNVDHVQRLILAAALLRREGDTRTVG
ncbi:MAG: hypothetical protein ABI186_02005 [Candidatus Elarobacter sp.]